LAVSALLSFYAVFVANSALVNAWLLGMAIFHMLCGLMLLLLILFTQRVHLLRVPQ